MPLTYQIAKLSQKQIFYGHDSVDSKRKNFICNNGDIWLKCILLLRFKTIPALIHNCWTLNCKFTIWNTLSKSVQKTPHEEILWGLNGRISLTFIYRHRRTKMVFDNIWLSNILPHRHFVWRPDNSLTHGLQQRQSERQH